MTMEPEYFRTIWVDTASEWGEELARAGLMPAALIGLSPEENNYNFQLITLEGVDLEHTIGLLRFVADQLEETLRRQAH